MAESTYGHRVNAGLEHLKRLEGRLARLERKMESIETRLVYIHCSVDAGAAFWSFATPQPTVTLTPAR